MGMPYSRVVGILLAAGSGRRLGAEAPKGLVEVAGKPLVRWAAEALDAGGVSDIICVISPEHNGLGWSAGLSDLVCAIPATGGATRAESVRNTVLALEDIVTPAWGGRFDPAAIDAVLVHDAARAFVPPEVVARVIAAVRQGGVAVAPVLPLVDSLRLSDAAGGSAPFDRSRLRAVQTPQGFDYEVLLAAHAEPHPEATDDLVVVEAAGHPISLIPGDERAFKITTPADLARARGTIGTTPSASELTTPGLPGTGGSRQGVDMGHRSGIGFDAHRFAGPGPLHLAGLSFPDELEALSGHSDGDVAAHALCDALLSAAGLGDLGAVFGTEDPAWSDAPGVRLLDRVAGLVRQAGFEIENGAVQVIGNHPRLASRRARCEQILSQAIGAPVSLSATTTDGMGFTGAGEGLAAIATALLRPARP